MVGSSPLSLNFPTNLGHTQAWTTKSWPHGGKAAAVTEVARESISAAGSIASELVSSTTTLPQTRSPSRPASIQLIKKTGASNRSLPADATTTLINIDSNGSASDPTVNEGVPQHDIPSNQDSDKSSSKQTPTAIKEDPNTEETTTTHNNNQTSPVPEKDPASGERPASTWLGWFSFTRTSIDQPVLEDTSMGEPTDPAEPTPAAAAQPQRDTESPDAGQNVTEANTEPQTGTPIGIDQETQNDVPVPAPPKRSWMQMWGTTNPSQAKDRQEEDSVKEPRVDQDEPMGKDTVSKNDDQSTHPDTTQESDSRKRTSGSIKSSGWSFWSRDVTNTEQKQGNPQTLPHSPRRTIRRPHESSFHALSLTNFSLSSRYFPSTR